MFLTPRVMDAAIGSAAPLVSFGVIIGKFSPLQLLIMTLIEIPIFVLNAHIGYSLLGALDAGMDNSCHLVTSFLGIILSTRFSQGVPFLSTLLAPILAWPSAS